MPKAWALLLPAVAFACSGRTADGADGPRVPPPVVAAAPRPVEAAPSPERKASRKIELPALPDVRAFPAGLSDAELARRFASEPAAFGSMSIGKPNRGVLFNAVQMPESPLWHVVEPKRAWGTAEAIRSIMLAVSRVAAEYPDSPKVHVGHLSSPRGGYLRPHRSHQTGRDVDLGYYYLGGERWYSRANATNLDRPRTWAFVRALASDPNVEAIFIDRSLQKLLREHAESTGTSPAELDALFDDKPKTERLVRHTWGHLTHMHVRFRSEASTEAGQRSNRALVAARQIPQRRYY